MSWALVAHTYNSRYSGGGDQEDQDLKSACAKMSRDHISMEKAEHGDTGLASQLLQEA
jgi:hypothetical protein